MSERPNAATPSLSGRTEVQDTGDVLLLADDARARELFVERYAQASERTDGLVVTFDGRLNDWLDTIDRLDEPRPGFTIVPVGDDHRSATASNASTRQLRLGDDIRIEVVVDPSDAAAIAETVSDALPRHRNRDGSPTLWIHALEAASELLDSESAVELARTVVEGSRAGGTGAVFHVDPSAADAPTIRSLIPLFDEVVRLEEEVETPTVDSQQADANADVDASEPSTGGSRAAGEPAGSRAGGASRDVAAPTSDLGRVVVVGERPEMLEMAVAFLERSGDFAVETESDPSRLFEADRHERIDCVVSGTHLEGLSPAEFRGGLATRDADLPLLWLADSPEEVPSAVDVAHVFDQTREGYRELAAFLPLAVDRAATQRYRQAFEHSPDPVALLRPDGIVEEYGASIDELLLGGPGNVRPETVQALFDSEAIHEGLEAVRDGERWVGETELDAAFQPDDEKIAVRISLTPVASGGRVVASLVDVTDYRERERELERDVERLEGAAELLAHDVQNLMTVIDGNLEFAREGLETAESTFDRIHGRFEDAAVLTGDSDVDPEALVHLETAVRETWEAIDTGDASLVVEGDVSLTANRSLLERLLENLLINAVTHGGEGVSVRVGATDEGFYVADDGAGIPPADRERIFEERYSTGGSTGLGMSVVERAVEAHEWEIDVGESSEGGALFEITGVSLDRGRRSESR